METNNNNTTSELGDISALETAAVPEVPHQDVSEETEKQDGTRVAPLGGRVGNPLGGEGHWTDEPQKTKSRFSRVSRISALIAVSLASFFFFLYLTFPYGVIKEVAVLQITDALQKSGLPVQIRVGTFSPHWFTGVKLENVVVSNINDSSVQMKLNEVTVRVNVLPILIGNLSVNAYIEQGKGNIDAFFKSSIFGLAQGSLPKEVNVEFDNFSLEPIFKHALAIPKSSRDPNMLLIQPIISKTTAGGALTGKIVFETTDKMKGRVNLEAKNAFLLIEDETLKIPQQDFSVFKIDIQYQNGALNLGEATKFQAPDIGIGLNGTITLPETQTATTQANLNLHLAMHGQIEKSLGMIVPNILRCRPLVNGELQAKLQGPIAMMNCL